LLPEEAAARGPGPTAPNPVALNPAAAFIKAGKAVYDIVRFFVDKASQVEEFVNSVLDSVESADTRNSTSVRPGRLRLFFGLFLPLHEGLRHLLLRALRALLGFRSLLALRDRPLHRLLRSRRTPVLTPLPSGSGSSRRR
jgi:hypothetical protein